jgi:hypothetical protein
MKINDIVNESWNPDKEYPDTEQGAIECFTDISEYKPNEVTKVYPDPYTPYVWAVHTNTKRYGPQKHVVWINEKDFATDDRSGEEDFRVNESTTAGSIATVAAPMTTQKRNGVGKGIYGNEKAGNLLTGKKTNKKYANSVNESEEKDYSKMSRDEKIAYHNRQMNAAHGKLTGRYWYHKDQLARFKKKPVSESKMKELATDMRNMDNGNFQKKYKKSKEQLKFVLGDPDAKKTVHEAKKAATPGTGKVDIDNNKFYVWAWDGEVVVYGTFDSLADAKSNKSKIEQSAIKRVGPYVEGQFRVSQGDDLIHRYLSEAELQEDDVIIVPGQGRSRKTGFIKHGESRLDHEVEMARSDLFSAAKNAKQVYEMIEDLSEEEGLEGWVQEKIIKANDYLNTIREYLEGKQLREMTGGVIAGGGVGESAGGTTIRTFSGDRCVVPAGQEHELDDYRNAVGIIKKNRRSPVPSDVYDEALATMMKYEEGQTGWRPADGVNEGIVDTLKQVGKGISDKVTTMTSKEHREKWHVSGFTLNKKPGGGIMGRADYFITNEKFPNKKEALAYIKASQAKLNSYGKVGYFSLFVNISDHYFSDEPLFSKIEDPNKNEVQEGIGDKIKGAVRREKAKDLPLLQTRRDYAMGKGGEAYNKGEIRKGNQYMAYAEKDRKKSGDPSTNPAGTYRTKTSDYKG